MKSSNNAPLKKGDKVYADPRLTGLNDWIEGTVIDVEQNPFKGIVIAVKDILQRSGKRLSLPKQ